ncbi:MAG: sulfite exporter TauE/SafE family protein [Actinobacteria bacterium]|nr:sulfite exporter TauE/SafE family protein [Actinomycetota bacterium]
MAICTVVFAWGSGAASAHPLGNFTINTASEIVVGRSSASVRFVVDMAEIPALQTAPRIDTDGNGSSDAGERSAFAAGACRDHQRELDLEVDGSSAALKLLGSQVSFPPGQAGLSTLRLECSYRAPLALETERRVSFTSRALDDRVGWREITAIGDRVTITTPGVRRISPSAHLTKYPEDPLQAPLRETSVSFSARPGGAPLATAPPGGPAESPQGRGPASRFTGLDAATDAFSRFVGRRDLSVGVGALGLALSLFLGAVHALAPGHGKTVMAAYLVGQRGSARQAAVIGLTVTATHTLGVLGLGIAIAGSQVVTPERLYPYLGTVSGLLLAAIGANLLRNAVRARRSAAPSVPAPPTHHAHPHGHDGHDHDHHDHDDHHNHDHERAAEPGWHAHGGRLHRHAPIVEGQPLTWSNLLALGFVGGLLPSPSAVVVLLGAIALGRAWFGVLLVVAYGVGMAATLMGAGLLLVRARGLLERRLARFLDRGGTPLLNTLLPFGTSAVIVVVGLLLAADGALNIPR